MSLFEVLPSDHASIIELGQKLETLKRSDGYSALLKLLEAQRNDAGLEHLRNSVLPKSDPGRKPKGYYLALVDFCQGLPQRIDTLIEAGIAARAQLADEKEKLDPAIFRQAMGGGSTAV